MFSKLALKNVTRSVRDYSVYFLTLMFGVCIFYVFNSLDSQWVMESLRGSTGTNDTTRQALDMILTLIDIFSVFVSVILAFLILYANNFMVKRRKKELGTYLLLGLSQGRVAALLFAETALIGLISLGAGLALGIFLSQFLSVFTAGFFQITVTEFHFVFSWKALGKTLLYFSLIFLVVMVFNSLTVSRQKLIDLLQAERKSERLRGRSLGLSVALFLLSLVLLAVAYAMLLIRGMLRVDALFYLMLALGSLGTLLFFRGLSGFLLQVLQSNKRLYYRGLNMFTLRQFAARVGSNYLSMTVICLMLLLSIGITACSVGLNNTLDSITGAQAPYDFYLAATALDPETGEETAVDVPAALKEAGFDPEVELEQSAQVALWQGVVTWVTGDQEEVVVFLLPLSGYNGMRSLSGREPIALAGDRCTWVIGEENDVAGRLARDGQVFRVNGHDLAVDGTAVSREDLSLGYDPTPRSYLIVPDAVLDGAEEQGTGGVSLNLNIDYFCGNYRADAPKEETEERFQSVLSDFERIAFRAEAGGGGWIRCQTRLEVYLETMGTKMMVLFLGIYLGIVFLLCSAAVLALQQLSQAADNVPRYRILSRLGVEEKMMHRSVDIQVLLAFLLPLALALVHSVVGMTAANQVIAQVGRLDAAASSAVTGVFLVIFYGAYFLATCAGSRRLARGR